MTSYDHLLSIQRLDEAIHSATKDITNPATERSKASSHRRSSTPRREKVIEVSSPGTSINGSLTASVVSRSGQFMQGPWIPYGHGGFDRPTSAHKNVNIEGSERGQQYQQLRKQRPFYDPGANQSLAYDGTFMYDDCRSILSQASFKVDRRRGDDTSTLTYPSTGILPLPSHSKALYRDNSEATIYHIDRKPSRSSITSQSCSRTTSPSATIASNTKFKVQPDNNKYHSDNYILLRATLIDTTPKRTVLDNKQGIGSVSGKNEMKIVYGMLSLRRKYFSLRELSQDIENQWRIGKSQPLSDNREDGADSSNNSKCIIDIRIISTSSYSNRMHIRCLSLDTIEEQPSIDDSSCHVEVYIGDRTDLETDRRSVLAMDEGYGISSTIDRVLIADLGRSISPTPNKTRRLKISPSLQSQSHGVDDQSIRQSPIDSSERMIYSPPMTTNDLTTVSSSSSDASNSIKDHVLQYPMVISKPHRFSQTEENVLLAYQGNRKIYNPINGVSDQIIAREAPKSSRSPTIHEFLNHSSQKDALHDDEVENNTVNVNKRTDEVYNSLPLHQKSNPSTIMAPSSASQGYSYGNNQLQQEIHQMQQLIQQQDQLIQYLPGYKDKKDSRPNGSSYQHDLSPPIKSIPILDTNQHHRVNVATEFIPIQHAHGYQGYLIASQLQYDFESEIIGTDDDYSRDTDSIASSSIGHNPSLNAIPSKIIG